jgi:hypothetical protein
VQGPEQAPVPQNQQKTLTFNIILYGTN